jgi:aminodeoxychorismate synthase component I
VTPPRINLSSSEGTTPQENPWISGFVQPRYTLRCHPVTLETVAFAGQTPFMRWDDPLAALAWMSMTFPASTGRWIGHINYDLGRLFEQLPSRAAEDLRLPLFHFTFCTPRQERSAVPDPTYERSDQPLTSSFTRRGYEAAVRKCLDYIAAGDVFQINLSQRLNVGLADDPARIYQRLVREAPARYGALLSYGDYAIISNSPELFLHVTSDRRVITRPIKGTRPRSDGMEQELRESTKDEAELNMIVDLERNDLGRVCEIGSVGVAEPRAIETHPTVYHGVATIEGQLREDVGFVDLLRATFPGGSITGAPKIRAMQIIEELEPLRRGPYCGAIGYLAADGSMQFNIAIRTMIVRHGLIHIPVGGGIVADSSPAAEYEETLVKARAMLSAVGVEESEVHRLRE